jgi:hypothetical protein
MKLAVVTFNEYHQAIEVIRNREMLSQLVVASYPHVVDADREKSRKQISKIAFPNEKKKVKTFDDFAVMVNKWQN